MGLAWPVSQQMRMEYMIHLQDTVCRACAWFQGVVWSACCSGCTMGVFLQEVIWSRWHSLKPGWCSYHILILLLGEGMGKAEVGYVNFGETIEMWSTQKLWWEEAELGYIGFGEATENRNSWRLQIQGGEGRTYRFWGEHWKVE